MTIETVDDLVEEIANWLHIYGGCKSDGDEGCEWDEKKPFCCRQGFCMDLKERIEKSVENDKKIAEVGL